jgi:MFS family permease
MRLPQLATAMCIAVLSLGFAASANAETVVQQTNVEAPEDEGPSIISQGYQGLLAGAVVGLGGGYLAARRDEWEKSDWRAVGLGIGIGALAGAGLGLTLGFMDKGGVTAGRYIARDLLAGAGFGAVLGALAGGISAAVQSEAEHILFGAAIGVVAGAGLGIITGIVEGQRKGRERNTTGNTTVTSRLRLAPSLSFARVADGSRTALPAIAARF